MRRCPAAARPRRIWPASPVRWRGWAVADAGSAAVMPASAARSQEASLAARQRRTAWLFLAPLLLVLAAVAGWPLLRTIAFSFTDAYLADLASWQFVGLANYLYLRSEEHTSELQSL